MRAGVDRRAMASLSLGHFAADFAQGAPPALLVFLKSEFHLSYTKTAAVILAATLSSSIVQPLFGRFSDRRGAMWLLPVGVAVAAVGIGVYAIVPSYAVLLPVAFAAGLGIGAFHPEGAKFAGFASGTKRASGMAVFSIGGNFGFAAGPLAATTAVHALGLHGGLLLMIPGLIVTVLLLQERRYLAHFEPTVARKRSTAGEDQLWAVWLLVVVTLLRGVAYMGLFTLVPFWEEHLGHGKQHGSILLSVILASGAVGTFFGGPIADRFGAKQQVLWSLALATPLMVVYVLVGGFVGDVAVALSGAALISNFGVSLVMAQEYLPNDIALASGLSVGLSIGLGGVAAVVLGAVADSIDLRTALLVAAAGPVVGAVIGLGLPPVRRRALEPAAAPV
jgi:FSR family fosmidomycin resistance protein-like MFS transporter